MNKQVNYGINKRNFIPENNKIVLTIPDNFIGKQIEVFATEIANSFAEHSKKVRQPFIVVDVRVEGYKFNRGQANERYKFH
jgi:hypothetical protein